MVLNNLLHKSVDSSLHHTYQEAFIIHMLKSVSIIPKSKFTSYTHKKASIIPTDKVTPYLIIYTMHDACPSSVKTSSYLTSHTHKASLHHPYVSALEFLSYTTDVIHHTLSTMI